MNQTALDQSEVFLRLAVDSFANEEVKRDHLIGEELQEQQFEWEEDEN